MKKEAVDKILQEDFKKIVFYIDNIEKILVKKDDVVIEKDCVVVLISENRRKKYIDIDSIKAIDLIA